ncbi:MAG: hypothetical protein KDC38_11305, partial [Planctomycetes bacterium]|nr:hypothetical protein [Planctomycetota bacterium]
LEERVRPEEPIALLDGSSTSASLLSIHLGRWVEALAVEDAPTWDGLVVERGDVAMPGVRDSIVIPTRHGETTFVLLENRPHLRGDGVEHL